MAIMGAFTQAPKHSTSEIVNKLSFVVSPTSMPNFFCERNRGKCHGILGNASHLSNANETHPARIENGIGITKPARCCRAHLNMIFSGWFSQEHRVKCCHLVDAHVWQFQNFGHLMHGRNGQPSVLTLSQIEQWNHCTALMSIGIDAKNGFDTLQRKNEIKMQ